MHPVRTSAPPAHFLDASSLLPRRPSVAPRPSLTVFFSRTSTLRHICLMPAKRPAQARATQASSGHYPSVKRTLRKLQVGTTQALWWSDVPLGDHLPVLVALGGARGCPPPVSSSWSTSILSGRLLSIFSPSAVNSQSVHYHSQPVRCQFSIPLNRYSAIVHSPSPPFLVVSMPLHRCMTPPR
ncbi:uncharacterized protein SCHCODRAFT_02716226 [Schizophyllum commune H4-8]|uniref:uncharacterized protein n=1 Tax=Schizophyllum commune (strain H4-8 / FGSC 9210) TaxID=578458 RepID=UPI00216109D6|nr:uncharacterized protein SCHCODRAFT_02716226 [Schizophyllum commune H4-8]KAI5886395.1 hypothetical protein SCHCODRAFT_02716226 [Schizophyllum commune H4-8]